MLPWLSQNHDMIFPIETPILVKEETVYPGRGSGLRADSELLLLETALIDGRAISIIHV